ncbi:MAG: glycosyltransferase family 4 protein [Ferruginibacter sp.]|nr:glycosyltransferase family 4 protein [Ferruginibacter sp.]
MKILFYQSKGATLSINLLFNIIRQNLPGSVKFSTSYFRYTGSSIKDRVYDVFSVVLKSRNVINHVIGDFNYATYFMPKGNTILTIHDLYRLYVYNNSPFKVFIFKWFWLRVPIVKSAVVTAVSQCTKNEIVKYANCPPGKIRVIYNCISPDFQPAPKIFNKLKPVLLQMGTRANKNLERLVQAIAGIHCKLDIVGEPNPETFKLLDQYKIDHCWANNLSKKEIIKKYNACDMLVFVSTYEGFGMPIIEANAVERAVVTANVSAMPEIAGMAACLVDPFDIEAIRNGIMRVIEDDEYRQQLIEAGRKNKARFEAKNIANQYCDLYKEVWSKI